MPRKGRRGRGHQLSGTKARKGPPTFWHLRNGWPPTTLDQFAEDGLEDGQRESGAGLAEGTVGEGAASHQGDVGQGGVAVEDLNEEPVDDGRRSQETAIAP